VSPRKRTVSGSSKAHQPSTSSEGLHAFNGILEDIAVLRSRGGDKAIQAVQEARKLLQAAMEVTYQEEKAAAMDVPQQKKRRY
jgi:hypothetical protein